MQIRPQLPPSSSRLPRGATLAASILLAACGSPAEKEPAPETPVEAPTPVEALRGQCLPDTEQSWFDCATTAGAWLSVCGPKGETTSWLQLRHGTPMAAELRVPPSPAGLDGLRWESTRDSGSLARAMHFGEGAFVSTLLPEHGEPHAGAQLPDRTRVTCRPTDVEDSLPDVASLVPPLGSPLANAGRLDALQNGDAACYVLLESALGARNYYGEFELCQTAAAQVGKHVVLTFEPGRVIAPSCQGDPECQDSIEVQLVVGITTR